MNYVWNPRAAFFFAVIVSQSAGVCWGAIIAKDDFNAYALGELHEKSGGSGWAAAWGAVTAATEVVDPSPNLKAGGIDGGDRALRLTQPNNNNAATRNLASSVSAGDLFFSFLFRFDAGTITNNDFLGFWMDTGSSGDHTNVPNIGLKGELGPGGTDYYVRLKLNNETYSTTQALLGQTVQLVGRLQKTGVSTVYNSISLWVSPGYGSLGSPDATASAGGSLASFSTVGFRTANLASGDTLLVDELVLSTSWGDVVVPEPGSVSIWIGTLAIFLLASRVARRYHRFAAVTGNERDRGC